MSQYFDKDFLKFFLGFVAIIIISLTIIVATRLYETRPNQTPDAVVNTANPN